MEIVHFNINNHIATIVLNRPDKRNALNAEMVTAFKDVLKTIETNKEVKIVLLKGAGEAFCAGADLAYLQQLQKNTFDENLMDSANLAGLFETLYRYKIPVVAQVQGAAIAGGCGLLTVCDYVIAEENVKLGFTEVKIGFIPAIVSTFLLKKVGEGAARELLIFGELIDASRALHIGLINMIVAADKLEEATNTFLQKIIKSNSAQAMSTTKKLLSEIGDLTVNENLNLLVEANAMARGTVDCKRGIDAFLKKEKILW